MNRNSYEFVRVNRKAALYFLVGMVLMLLLFALSIVFPKISFNLMVVLGFIAVVIGLFIGIKKSKQKECITMDNDGFTSLVFGRVAYSDIRTIRMYNPWLATSLSMKMYLNNGKKLGWIIAVDQKEMVTNKDAIVFNLFLQDLQNKLDTLRKKSPSQHTHKTAVSSTFSDSDEKSLASQLRTERQKASATKVWAIPVSFAFAILALARTCAPGIAKKLRNDPDFSKLYAYQKRTFDIKTNTALKIATAQLHKNGSIFLYTNDPSANVQVLPNISSDDYTDEALKKIPALQLVERNEQLQKFIDNPDSVGIVYVIKTNRSKAYPLYVNPNKHYLNFNDSSGMPKMYFIAHDSALHVVPMGEQVTPRDSLLYPAFLFTNSFVVDPRQSMMENLESAAPAIKMMFANAHFRPTFNLYFLGSAKDGITPEMMQSITQTINKKASKSQMDTTTFVLRRYN